jgi:hypothetical protein
MYVGEKEKDRKLTTDMCFRDGIAAEVNGQ